jgi:hypothetical protein
MILLLYMKFRSLIIISISLSRPQVVRNQIKSFAMNKVTLPPGRYVRYILSLLSQ